MAETLDEAAIPRETGIGNDHVINRALFSARARETNND
jgi:hypothetical protein